MKKIEKLENKLEKINNEIKKLSQEKNEIIKQIRSEQFHEFNKVMDSKGIKFEDLIELIK